MDVDVDVVVVVDDIKGRWSAGEMDQLPGFVVHDYVYDHDHVYDRGTKRSWRSLLRPAIRAEQ